MNKFNIQYSIFNLQRSSHRGQFHIIGLVASLVVMAAGGRAEPPAARASFDAGVQAFAASNFTDAVTAFDTAAAAAPAEKLDPAVARYNAGLAAAAAGDLEAAAVHFNAAAAAADLGLQARAYYNRGNALFHLADMPLQPQALPGGDPAPALDTSESAIGQAIQMYENAIALDPDDADAKANYELALLKQQQIQQMQQQQNEQNQQDQQDEQNQQDQDNQDQQDPSPQQQQNQDQPQPQPEEQPDQQPQPQQGDRQEQAGQSQQPESAEDMTPEEAEMLLDALRQQEQSQRDRLHPFLGRPVPVEKDW